MMQRKHVVYRDVDVLYQIYEDALFMLGQILSRVQSISNIDNTSSFRKVEMLSSHRAENIKGMNDSIKAGKLYPYQFHGGGYVIVPDSDDKFNNYIESHNTYPVLMDSGYTRIDFYNYLKDLMKYTIERSIMVREDMESKRYAEDIGKAKRLNIPLSKISYEDIDAIKTRRKVLGMSSESELEGMMSAFENLKTDASRLPAVEASSENKGTSSFSDFKAEGGVLFVDGKPVHDVSEYLHKVQLKKRSDKKVKSTQGSITKPDRKGTDTPSKLEPRKVSQSVDTPKLSQSASTKPEVKVEEIKSESGYSISAVTQEVGSEKIEKFAKGNKKKTKVADTTGKTKKSGLVSALEHEDLEVVKSGSIELGGKSKSEVFKIVPKSEVSVKGTEEPTTQERKVVLWDSNRLQTVEYELIQPNIPFNNEFKAQRGKLKGKAGLASLDDLDEAELIRCYPQLERHIRYAFESMKTTDKSSLPADSPRLIYVDDEAGLRFTEEERFLVSLANSPLLQELYREFQNSCRVFETPTGVALEKYHQLIHFWTPSNGLDSETYPSFTKDFDNHELMKLRVVRWKSVLTSDELERHNELRSKILGFYGRNKQFTDKYGFFFESICNPGCFDIPLYSFMDERKALYLYSEYGYYWSPYYLDLLSLSKSEMCEYPPEVVRMFKVLRSKRCKV